MKTITITFDTDGNPTIETSGFEGKSCKTETAALEAFLAGQPVQTTTWKPEAFKAARPTSTSQKAGR